MTRTTLFLCLALAAGPVGACARGDCPDGPPPPGPCDGARVPEGSACIYDPCAPEGYTVMPLDAVHRLPPDWADCAARPPAPPPGPPGWLARLLGR